MCFLEFGVHACQLLFCLFLVALLFYLDLLDTVFGICFLTFPLSFVFLSSLLARRVLTKDLTELADNLCQSDSFLLELKLVSKNPKPLDKVVIVVLDLVIKLPLFTILLYFELLGEGFILLCESAFQSFVSLSLLKCL